jgi:hypothetical protein
MKKSLDEVNQIHNFISSSGSGTVINYGSGSDFLTSYGSYGSGSTTLPTGPTARPPAGLSSEQRITKDPQKLTELDSLNGKRRYNER